MGVSLIKVEHSVEQGLLFVLLVVNGMFEVGQQDKGNLVCGVTREDW